MPSVLRTLKRPTFRVSLLLSAAGTLPVLYYGRYLIALDPVTAVLSLAVSFVGTSSAYMLLMQVAGRREWLHRLLSLSVAAWLVALQLVYFGIYREFATLPTVSIVDFARQTPQYAWALFVDRLDVVSIGAAVAIISAIAVALRIGFRARAQATAKELIVWGALVTLSSVVARHPFMSFEQQAATLIVRSSHGPGLVNAAWTPDRVRPALVPALRPVNVVVFRLEEVAARATSLERPELPTTPFLKELVDERPREAFVAHQHYANSTATDVSVLTIYSGLAAAAELEAHRTAPLLWDYFSAAGYDTSLFLPFHLEWGDFRHRFEARPGETSLDKLVDAGNSGLPIVYDNSINDTDVVNGALAYQKGRAWTEPFLQIVSIKMPHAIGEGARVNKYSYGDWAGEPPELSDYYNGIRHDDALMRQYIDEMPEATRARTIFAVLSDHGTRLIARSDGAEELHRLDNYHQETTRVPFVLLVPEGIQDTIGPDKLQALRTNLSTRSTSNIDMVPTLLGLVGIQPANVDVANSELLAGRDLTVSQQETSAIVQLNTGPLRRWDREHFAIVLGNGDYHYMFSMGRELLYDVRADPLEQHSLVDSLASHSILAQARAISTQLPELLRIQQKYRREDPLGMAHAAEAPAPLNVLEARRVPGDALLRPGHSGEAELLAEYSIPVPPAGMTAKATFAIQVSRGEARLEWRLRSGPKFNHFIHLSRLASADGRQLAFRWRPESRDAGPLSIQLFGRAVVSDFGLRMEEAEAHAIPGEMDREFEILTLARTGPARPGETYRLPQFKVHPCLGKPTMESCPNGYLSWGPYAKATRGTDLQLRYDVETARAGVTVWLDMASMGGSERLARSEPIELTEPGLHSFELATTLERDAELIEGRINVSASPSLEGHSVKLRGAELGLAARTSH